MTDPIAWIDALAADVPPLLRIICWAVASASISMAIYAKLSPQEKLVATKSAQKTARQALLRYDGEWDGMRALIITDLSLSLKQLGLVIGPFVVSVAPVVFLIYRLSEMYGDAEYVSFGPVWMRGFDFWYIAVAVIVSLAIKIIFKIA